MTAAVDLFQLDTEHLSAQTEAEVLAVYARWFNGELDTDTAIVLIAAIVNRANAAAISSADAWLAVQIELKPVSQSRRWVLRRRTPPIGS